MFPRLTISGHFTYKNGGEGLLGQIDPSVCGRGRQCAPVRKVVLCDLDVRHTRDLTEE